MDNVKKLRADLKRAALGAVLGGSLLVTMGLGVAQAGPLPPPSGSDGLVNVVVGGATVLDSVPDAQAVQAVSGLCTLPAPAVDAMVAKVDAAGGGETACTGRSGGDVVLAQNLPGAQEISPVVPSTKASFGSGTGAVDPAGPEPIAGNLPTEPDNMSSEN
jgi:hypothetical protein